MAVVIGLFICQVNGMYRAYELSSKKPELTPEKLAAQKRVFDLLREERLKKNIFSICAERTGECIPVPMDVLIHCENISNLIVGVEAMRGEVQKTIEIPSYYSFQTIKNVFYILESKKPKEELIKKLSALVPEQLVTETNFAIDYLGVQKEQSDIFVDAVLNKIVNIHNELFIMEDSAFSKMESIIRKDLLNKPDYTAFNNLNQTLLRAVTEKFQEEVLKGKIKGIKMGEYNDAYIEWGRYPLTTTKEDALRSYYSWVWDIRGVKFQDGQIVTIKFGTLSIGNLLNLLKMSIEKTLNLHQKYIKERKYWQQIYDWFYETNL